MLHPDSTETWQFTLLIPGKFPDAIPEAAGCIGS